MKKFRWKLYTIFASFFIVTFLIFGIGYYYITVNYIYGQIGDNFVYMTEKVAVDLNLQINRDYETFINAYETSGKSQEEFVDDLNNNNDNKFIIDNIDKDYKLGYIDSDNNFYIDDKYQLKNKVKIEEVTEKISIYTFNNILNKNILVDERPTMVDHSDKTIYMSFYYDNVILYFKASDYINPIIDDIDGMPESEYMIIQKDSTVLIKEDIDITNIKLIISDIKDLASKYRYEDMAKNLMAEESSSGYGIFNMNDSKSYLVYVPIIKNLVNDTIYLGYQIEFSRAISSMYNLQVMLIITFSFLFVVLNIAFILSGISYKRKEQDLSLSQINYHFLKPLVLVIDRKGIIKGMNKSFRVNVDDINQYVTADDITLFENDTTIMELIKHQLSFTAVLKDINKFPLYIHFIAIKSYGKYYLLGENYTSQVEESIKNKKIALYNVVTDLPNKNLLDKTLNEMVSEGVINTTNNSLIAIDVTEFGKINRIFGYSAADKMLRAVSEIIKESVADLNADIYNIRTSLFMVLIRNVSTYNEVITWSKECLVKLQAPIDIKGGYLISVESKMGIFNIEPTKVEDLDAVKIYECATTALDRARNSRLTKCAIYNSEFGKMLTRDQIMEEDLRTAIDNREFVMYYQAQYNTKYKRIVGFEALIRWNNPKYRLESVEHFISLAEKNGMIVEIGRIIIEETFKFAKSIESTGIHISMNVSPVQLLQSGFVNDLIDYYNKYEITPGLIAIEITETFLMENSDAIIAKLKLLRDKGFSIHLDDFGIGYSSMLYLKDLPVDFIKIDKEFTKHILNDKFSRIIVTKVVQIALNLNLDVIAEGVETEKQSDLLSKMGCNIIQGYLISKAIPGDEAIKLIEKYSPDMAKIKVEKEKPLDEFADDVPEINDEAKPKGKK